MQDFRVALVQCSSKVDGSPELNLDLFEKSLKETTENGSQFTCFPEVSLSGYVQKTEDVLSRALSLDDRIVRKAVALSEKYATYYSFGFFEKSDQKIFNTYVMAGKGKLIGTYRKIHIAPREGHSVSPGPEFKVFDLPFARVGFSICYDNFFCESHMILALKGAELIVMPHAWAEHWEKMDFKNCTTDEEVIRERTQFMHMLYGARCFDTGTYSAMVDHSGIEANGPWRFVGKSMVFSPTGKTLSETKGWDDEIIYAELSGKLLDEFRSIDGYTLKMRRPQTYGPISDTSYRFGKP